jgi:hypothetical protein
MTVPSVDQSVEKCALDDLPFLKYKFVTAFLDVSLVVCVS